MDDELAQAQRSSYFNAMRDFKSAITERRYSQALRFLRIGLPLTVPAEASLDESLGKHNPERVPLFLGPTAGAIAALFDDSDIFDQMDEVFSSRGYVVKIGVDRYRQDAQLVRSIRHTLATSPETTLEELKEVASRADGSAEGLVDSCPLVHAGGVKENDQ